MSVIPLILAAVASKINSFDSALTLGIIIVCYHYLFMFSGCMSCTPGLSDLGALMDGTCFVGISEILSRGCIHFHKVVFVETASAN